MESRRRSFPLINRCSEASVQQCAGSHADVPTLNEHALLPGTAQSPQFAVTGLCDVIVHRDSDGYGFSVSGDTPVCVFSVKPGGSAARAGLKLADRIVKVNGKSVASLTHSQVVDHISSSSSVLLTLQRAVTEPLSDMASGSPVARASTRKHPMCSRPLPPLPSTTSSPGNNNNNNINNSNNGTSANCVQKEITAPQPLDDQSRRHWDDRTSHTIQLMLEEQERHVDQLRAQLAVLAGASHAPHATSATSARLKLQLDTAEARRQQLVLRLTAVASPAGSPIISPSPSQCSAAAAAAVKHSSLVPQTGSVPGDEGGSWRGAPVPPPRTSLTEAGGGTAAPPPPLPTRGCDRAGEETPPALPPRTYRRVCSPDGGLCGDAAGTSSALTTPVNTPPVSVRPSCNNSNNTDNNNTDNNATPITLATLSVAGQSALASLVPLNICAAVMSPPRDAADAESDVPRRRGSVTSLGGTGAGLAVERALCRSDEECAVDSSGHVPPLTPPGTPPPPYGDVSAAPSSQQQQQQQQCCEEQQPHAASDSTTQNQLSRDMSPASPSANCKINQPFIMSIEDEDLSDQENYQDGHGSFNSLSNLLCDHARLAVFINYIFSNCDCSSLFFYLISTLYKQGSVKDMRRWAYEIHSSFLVPGAVMRVPGVDEAIVVKIDELLTHDMDKVDKLRTVFQKARMRARDEVLEQLSDFRSKRTAGLGAMFGPRDHELDEARLDRAKQSRIIEDVLVKLLDDVCSSCGGDLESLSERAQLHASCLATILYRHFNCRLAAVHQFLENCPVFITKERSFKSKLLSRYKKTAGTRGHQFQAHQYFIMTICNVCGDTIRGLSPQGYQCGQCEMNIHKNCLRTVEEQCVGSNPKRSGDKIIKFMDRLKSDQRRRTGSSTSNSAFNNERARRGDEGDVSSANDTVDVSGDSLAARNEVLPGSDLLCDVDPTTDHKLQSAVDAKSPNINSSENLMSSAKKASSISRSESCRAERDRISNKRHLREKRKRSDPNLPASKTSDVELDTEADPVNNNRSGSSSNSSLSARLESPSTSLDSVSANRASVGGGGAAAAGAGVAAAPLFVEGCVGWDSDMEVDVDPPDWKHNIPADFVRTLRPSERKRLDVANELIHTERSHVRNLKIIVYVFYRPMLSAGVMQPSDLSLLFGNVDELLETHSRFSDALKRLQRDDPMLEKIGEVLLNMFEGEDGDSFKTAAAAFCRCQSMALDRLKTLQKRDPRISSFLVEAESAAVCRRLQLKDILPTAMQRLTKYPLLLSSLCKHSTRGSEQYRLLQRACDSSRAILGHVNKVKGETERHERLVEIQCKLDQHMFCRFSDHSAVTEFGGRLDLTKYRMIHEGSVMFKFSNKSKHVELHMLLLERFIVLLQRQDDKYVLKFHGVNGRDMSPIIKNDNILVRPMATEKRAFFILHNLNVGPHIYELLYSSSNERDTWYRMITETADSSQSRDSSKGHKRTESAHSLMSHVHQQQRAQQGDTGRTSGAGDDSVSGARAKHVSESPCQATNSASGAAASTPTASPRNVTTTTTSSSQSPGSVSAGGSPSTSAAVAAAAPASCSSPVPGRRMQRVEMLKIAEATPLIDPSEVVVSQGVVLTAEAVLSPAEQLRRKDQQLTRLLDEKQRLLKSLMQSRTLAVCEDTAFESASASALKQEDSDDDDSAADVDVLLMRAVSVTDSCMSVLSSSLNPGDDDGSSSSSLSRMIELNRQLSATLTQLACVLSERGRQHALITAELRLCHQRIQQLERRRSRSPSPSAPHITADQSSEGAPIEQACAPAQNVVENSPDITAPALTSPPEKDDDTPATDSTEHAEHVECCEQQQQQQQQQEPTEQQQCVDTEASVSQSVDTSEQECGVIAEEDLSET